MDITMILQEYFIIPVIVACLVIGYCIKHIKALEKVSNEYIPAILAVCGIIIAITLNWPNIDVMIIIAGAFSGLASTGLHQAFSAFINNLSKEKS